MQRLEAELVKSKATIERLESESSSLDCQTMGTPAQHQVYMKKPEIQYIAWKV